nr:hypothetical protein [Tanacetum cinerariifolium]
MEDKKFIHRSDEHRNLYKALVEDYESDKIILDTYEDTVTLKRHRDDDVDKDKEPSTGSDWGSKRRREGKKPESTSALKEKSTKTTSKSTQGELAKQTDSRLCFNELMDTHVDFSAFLMNRLKVDTLTLELLAGPTYKLMKGSCKSLVELEFFLEEVYKETTDQLDWINPEGQQESAHNVYSKRRIIAVTELKIVEWHNYKHLDWITVRRDDDKLYKFKEGNFKRLRIQDIEDMLLLLVQVNLTNLRIEERFAFNVSLRMFTRSIVIQMESAHNVYSKRRIIAVTELKIVEWHNYKHLDWITVRRDDDKLYKFKEGNFKRLRIQDIEDMLLLLVQVNLTNLRIEERFAFNVSLRMFTRSIVIQMCVEDLNSNKDKQNRLMRIDELHKFSDGTLNDVHTPLDDRLKGIRMKYPPQTIWRKSDKERAAAMIQAIDKQQKTRRIMRSLERFVGGRLYEGDFKPEGSTQGYPLVSVEVLRYDKRSKSENMGIVSTEMELILEHTQQGIRHEVSVSAEGVEE